MLSYSRINPLCNLTHAHRHIIVHVSCVMLPSSPRLAEGRSNPHLLAIGDHMNRTNMQDDIMEMMKGEKNADDLGRSKSIDDLLLL